MIGLSRTPDTDPPDSAGCGCVVGLLLSVALAVAFLAGVMFGGGCGQ